MMRDLLRAFGLVTDPPPAHVIAFDKATQRVEAKLDRPDPFASMVCGMKKTSFKRRPAAPTQKKSGPPK